MEQAIVPLNKSVPETVLKDSQLYQMLVLVDAIQVGNTREKMVAALNSKSESSKKETLTLHQHCG